MMANKLISHNALLLFPGAALNVSVGQTHLSVAASTSEGRKHFPSPKRQKSRLSCCLWPAGSETDRSGDDDDGEDDGDDDGCCEEMQQEVEFKTFRFNAKCLEELKDDLYRTVTK